MRLIWYRVGCMRVRKKGWKKEGTNFLFIKINVQVTSLWYSYLRGVPLNKAHCEAKLLPFCMPSMSLTENPKLSIILSKTHWNKALQEGMEVLSEKLENATDSMWFLLFLDIYSVVHLIRCNSVDNKVDILFCTICFWKRGSFNYNFMFGMSIPFV